MKLTMLGTGCAMVTECYNTCFVISDDNRHMLVDGGGGGQILSQLKRVGLSVNDIHEVFVTHKHIDHIMGIVWIIRAICQNMAKGSFAGECNVYAHEEVIGLLSDMCEKLLHHKQTKFIGDRLHLIVVSDGESRSIIGRDVTFFDIQSTKAQQFGFSMILPDGSRLTCCGDEPYKDHEYEYAKNSKWLLHEAYCLYGERDIHKPYEKHHSTVKEASELAASLEVANLIMYHTEDTHIGDRKGLYINESREYFGGNIFVPDDLDVIEL